MRKLKYHCATTLDGFVARKDGSADCFLMQGPHVDEFIASLGGFDTAIMGRRTYEAGLKYGVSDPYPQMKTFVFSRTMKQSPNPKVNLVADNATKLVRDLKQQSGKDIWLVGAGDLAASLAAENLIDEITVKVNPVVLGEGIPLLAHLEGPGKLRLGDSKTYDNGVVLLSYTLE